MSPLDLQSTSATFCASVGPYVNFRQLSVRPQNLPSTSAKFLCVRATICQFFVLQRDLPSTFVNLPCACETFRKLSLSFYTSMGTSVKYPYVSIQHSSTLCPSARHSVNSPFVHATFHQLPSTLCLSVENILCESCTFRLTSDNFLCGCVTFRQLSVRLRYHPSSFSASAGYSVNVLCVHRTFCKSM